MKPQTKTHFKLSVQYYVPFDKLTEFMGAVTPYGRLLDNQQFSAIVRQSRNSIKGRNHRLDVIQYEVEKRSSITIGGLYRRMKGLAQYKHTFRTFNRDIMEMGIRGMAIIEVIRGGANGSTTIIRPSFPPINEDKESSSVVGGALAEGM